MMRLLLSIVFILGLLKIGLTRRVEWVDDDTIILEATREEDVGNVLFHQRHDVPYFYHSPINSNVKNRGIRGRGRSGRSERSYVHTCYSVLGDQGRCTTFQECFPMLYYGEGEHKGQIKHPVLAELLMSTSGPCQPPPLSFRDDFVPYQGNEEEPSVPEMLDFDRKDLICCPSTKSTPIPPSGSSDTKRPSHSNPPPERVQMRTTPSTSTISPKPSKVDAQSIKLSDNAPDAVAGFVSSLANNGFVATSPNKIIPRPTTGKPKPGFGQLGHRIPTRSTTTAPLPPQKENIISDSGNDESEEERPNSQNKISSKPSLAMTGRPQKNPTSEDASVPVKIYQTQGQTTGNAFSTKPSLEKVHAVDISVPDKVDKIPRPTNNSKRPFLSNQNPMTGDVYVPVIPVGSMMPDDFVIVNIPTTSKPTTEQPPSQQPTKQTPKPFPPDAVAGITNKIQETPGILEQAAPIPTTGNAGDLEQNQSSYNFTTVATASSSILSTERPKLPTNLNKAPCGRLNSSIDPKYPWVAAIKLGPKFICAGSLIDDYHIMTAASCIAHLSTIDIGKLRVYLGERILNTNMDGPTIMRKVIRAMRHRGFSITTLRNDIAILKLSLPIPIGTKRVKPVCLPLDEDQNLMLETSSEASIVGWGANWNQVQNDVTHASKLKVWSKDACLDKYRQFIPDTHFDDEDMLCAQRTTPSKSSSPKILLNIQNEEVVTDGSPLIIQDKNGIYQQIGISSWKLGSLSMYPRVLTRVSAYRNWIEKNRLRP